MWKARSLAEAQIWVLSFRWGPRAYYSEEIQCHYPFLPGTECFLAHIPLFSQRLLLLPMLAFIISLVPGPLVWLLCSLSWALSHDQCLQNMVHYVIILFTDLQSIFRASEIKSQFRSPAILPNPLNYITYSSRPLTKVQAGFLTLLMICLPSLSYELMFFSLPEIFCSWLIYWMLTESYHEPNVTIH